MARLILVTGGARSGKSDFASVLAGRLAERVVYLATGQALDLDKEMARRIAAHQRRRPEDWQTIEEPLEIEQAITGQVKNNRALIIIDCLTLFLSNLLLSGLTDSKILARVRKLSGFLRDIDNQVIMVTNEVGSGIVPDNQTARAFRDLQGRANCIMAKKADEVYLLVCGQPLKIKPQT